MKKIHRPLVVGNWKMNPSTIGAARKLFISIKKKTVRHDGVDVVIAPPAVFLSEIERLWKGSKKIALCEQSVYEEEEGAHTGETSISMLKSLNVKYIIIGHSERRAAGITDEGVNKRATLVLKNGLTPIICVGEKKRDTHGDYLSLIEKQLRTALQGVPKSRLANVVIAYEPIWAIGTGKTASPEDAYEMKLFIQKLLTDLYGRNYARKVRVLYGGSVKVNNSESLLIEGVVDGFLIGGASLKADEFTEIVKVAKKYAKA